MLQPIISVPHVIVQETQSRFTHLSHLGAASAGLGRDVTAMKLELLLMTTFLVLVVCHKHNEFGDHKFLSTHHDNLELAQPYTTLLQSFAP
jgi:hypothetical protein